MYAIFERTVYSETQSAERFATIEAALASLNVVHYDIDHAGLFADVFTADGRVLAIEKEKV